ncbi:FAD-dependent monooxygenase [Streptomyces olivaceus]|uniref:FAD-dependent monooxygenase n=1 Tax=Streptomyces olivaceus TaxID=47716 RepID=UPI001CCD3116|nr:FAD-dependent monooxygenase [Streptomyces olivaceus]MBZ6295923.1 FAD-dependent monooxygenase [Streptomyces olivaceus]MBZ6330901.1 FAD-dependent monooxygenase [Streptomyces olivaceus]
MSGGHVVVAGGGIGGLAAAAALASSGCEVTVVERAAYIGDVGSGLLLYQNGIAAADAISARLGKGIRAAGHVVGPEDVRVLMDSAGRVLARERIGEMGVRLGLPQVPILRSALQDLLLREATTAGAHIRLGTAVEGYSQDAGRVSVGLSDGTALDGDVLVAADGLNSVVRAAMLRDGPPQYLGYTSVRGRTVGSELHPQTFAVNGLGVQIFVAPADGNTLYWTAKITSPPGVWPAMGQQGALTALLDRIADWHEPVVRMVRSANAADLSVTDIHDRDPVSRWVEGRVALLGDAVHPMAPAMGQGANTAIEDAVVLAQSLREHADPDEALLRYQAARVGRTSRIVLHSRRQGAFDQGASREQARARDDVMKQRGRKDAATLDIVDWRPDRADPLDEADRGLGAPALRPGADAAGV